MSQEQEIVPQTANTVTSESVPATEVNALQTEAAQTTDSAPVIAAPAAPPEPEEDKRTKELITQRKKRQEAEKEAAYWKGRAEAAGTTQQPPQTHTVEAPANTAPPVIENFNTYEEYEKAKDEYLLSVAEQRVLTRLTQSHQKTQELTQQQQYQKRIDEAALEDSAVYEAANDPTLPVSQPMAQIIKQSEMAPQILKYLHSNRQESARIAALHPLMAAREMGIIEAQLKATPKPVVVPPKTVSAAPAPVTTVNTSGAATIDEDDLPIDEYIRRRNKAQFGR